MDSNTPNQENDHPRFSIPGIRIAFNLVLLWVLLPFLAPSSAAGAVNRVLLLHSFGRDFAPFDTFSETFRTELAQQMNGAVVFYDVDLASARFEGDEPEVAFNSYLLALFSDRQLDLLVPIGGPATRFAQKYRQGLFPSTPMLVAATDQRHLQSASLTTNEAVVSVANNLSQSIESILQVLPATTNIVVVVGNSAHERLWLEEMQREFQPLCQRVSFTWFNGLTFSQMQKRASLLPPRTAIFFALFYVDAEGIPYAGNRALSDLHTVANAPIFGSHDTQMGHGVVGGPLMLIEDLGRDTANVAARILRGEVPGSIKTPPHVPGTPVYDWRELQHWGISEASLPRSSTILFREPTFWQFYKWRIILAVLTACGAAAALYYQHFARLKCAHEAQVAFTRQLLLSQESERRRIASELHDGLGQALLLIKNRLGLLTTAAQHSPEVTRQLAALSATASRAISDVRAISQALRPTALEQIGLTKAIEWMIEQIGETSGTKFSPEIDNIDGLLSPDLEINLYRIVQEALNNVVKHANATQVIIAVRREPAGISVSILDNGRGFDSRNSEVQHSLRGRKPTLGLTGMAERAKILEGQLEILSAPDTGTRLTLMVPLSLSSKETQEQEAHTGSSFLPAPRPSIDSAG
jgi:signal transduction histidine kinase